MTKDKAVVLFSGGMDSTTALAHVIADGLEPVLLTVGYGSTHEHQEGDAAIRVRDYFNIDSEQHVFQSLPTHIFKGGDSALMGERHMPHASYEEVEERFTGPSPTVVPFRNANLLSVATALAVSRGAKYVYAAMHATDYGGWAYPDCSPEFLGSFAASVYVGTYHQVRLRTPFLYLTKALIVKRASELAAPLHLTWSCYDPVKVNRTNEEGEVYLDHLHCGECPTCAERIKAFSQAGYQDPVEYAIDYPEGGKSWPWTI